MRIINPTLDGNIEEYYGKALQEFSEERDQFFIKIIEEYDHFLVVSDKLENKRDEIVDNYTELKRADFRKIPNAIYDSAGRWYPNESDPIYNEQFLQISRYYGKKIKACNQSYVESTDKISEAYIQKNKKSCEELKAKKATLLAEAKQQCTTLLKNNHFSSEDIELYLARIEHAYKNDFLPIAEFIETYGASPPNEIEEQRKRLKGV